MKNLKKVLALALAFACAFTMFAGAAFSDEASIRPENAEAVSLLTSLNIIEGKTPDTFDPEGVVKRAEMAKMIYVIRTDGNDNADAYKDMPSSFKDIDGHWAQGYIKYLQNTNIISGRSKEKFDPEATVTTVEAFKMALVLAGYTPDEAKAGLVGPNWMSNTIALATTNQLDVDVRSEINGGCTRQDAAQILANTLSMEAVRWSNDINDFVPDAKTGLATGGATISVGLKWMDLYTNVGTLVKIDGKDLAIDMSSSDAADSDLPSVKSFTSLPKDYSDLMGLKVKVLFDDAKNNSVLGVYALPDNVVYTTTANSTGRDDEKLKFGGTTYSVEYYGNPGNAISTTSATNSGAIRTYQDGNQVNGTTLAQLDQNTFNPNMYTFVDTDANGKIDTLIVKTYNVGKVTYVSSDRIIAAGKTYKFVDEDIEEGLAKDDWVIITRNLYEDNNKIVKAEMTSAKLEGLRDKETTNKFIDSANVISGTDNTYCEYNIDGNWATGAAKYQEGSEKDLNTVKAGENVRAVVVNGIAFYIKKASGAGIGRIDNVAVIVNTDVDKALTNRVKIAFFDGTTAVVDVDDEDDGDVDVKDLIAGHAYEYSVSGGEYSFQRLRAGTNGTNLADVGGGNGTESYDEYYGDMTYLGSKGNLVGDIGSRMSKAGIYTIDDDAQVLLFQPAGASKTATTLDKIGYEHLENTTKVVTGKQFKAMDKVGAVSLVLTKESKGEKYKDAKRDDQTAQVYSFYGDMDGLDRIGALVVPVYSTENLNKTYNNYGYIVEDASKLDSRNIEYKLWTGEETVTVREEYTKTQDRLKGAVIGYDKLTTNSEDYSVIDDVTTLTLRDKKITFTAVKSVSNDEKTVQFYAPIAGADGRKELEVVRNSTVLYVNTKADTNDEIGVLEGDIKAAVKDPTNTSYMANALVFGTEDDVEVLVIEQTAWMDNGFYKSNVDTSGNVVYGFDPSDAADNAPISGVYATRADLVAALDTGNNVNAEDEIPNGSYTVKDGKTLTLDNPSLTGNVSISGNVTLVGNVDLTAANAKLNVRGGTFTIASDAVIDESAFNKISLSNITKVVDARSSTPAAQLKAFLAASNNVEIVSGNLKDLEDDPIDIKKLTVSGNLDVSGAKVSEFGNYNSTTAANVTVNGTLTVPAATTLIGTWDVHRLRVPGEVTAMNLTVNGTLTVDESTVTSIELTAKSTSEVTLPETVTTLDKLVLEAGVNNEKLTTVTAPKANVTTSLDTPVYTSLEVNVVPTTGWTAKDAESDKTTVTLNGRQDAVEIPAGVNVTLVQAPSGVIKNTTGSQLNIGFGIVDTDLRNIAVPVDGAKLYFSVAPSRSFTFNDSDPKFYNNSSATGDAITASSALKISTVYTGDETVDGDASSAVWVIK